LRPLRPSSFSEQEGQRYRRGATFASRLLPDFQHDRRPSGTDCRFPINMAFFYHGSPAGKESSPLYPSPGGVVESLLTAGGVAVVRGRQPGPRRPGTGRGGAAGEPGWGAARDSYRVSIDECFSGSRACSAAAGRGLSGGAEVWGRRSGAFFARLEGNKGAKGEATTCRTSVFQVGSAPRSRRFAAAPLLLFKLRRRQRRPGRADPRRSCWRCQVRIEPTKRAYGEERKAPSCANLFGEPHRWGQTLRKHALGTHTKRPWRRRSPGRRRRGPAPCPAPTTSTWRRRKYFAALEDGHVPLLLLFSGTVFHAAEDGSLPGSPKSPGRGRPSSGLPVQVWKDMMEHYYPNSAWLCLRQGTCSTDCIGTKIDPRPCRRGKQDPGKDFCPKAGEARPS